MHDTAQLKRIAIFLFVIVVMIGIALVGLQSSTQKMATISPSADYYSDSRTLKTSDSSLPAGGFKEGELTERKVVKNGSLSLLVKKAEETAQGIKDTAERLNGFVQDLNIYEVSAGTKAGAVTVRVPADKFDEAMNEIKKLAVRVEKETVNDQDVTEQYIDLEAQLKNLRAEEAQYLEIMKRADTIEDILKVSQPLNNVREKIERIEGQLKYLSRQVDMSLISVSITSEADTEVFGIYWRPLFIIKQSLRNMLSDLADYADAMIGFIFKLPVIILWLITIGVILFIIWKSILLVKTKFFPRRQ